MANHGFVTIQERKFTPEMVDRDLRAIVERRFLGEVDIDFKPTKNPMRGDILACWTITPKNVPDPKYIFEFEVWLTNARKLEFRHPHGQWGWWAQVAVLEEEFAYLYGGTVSDEGISERWKGSMEKLKTYPTFRSWIESMYTNLKIRRAMVALEMEYLPKSLRKLDEELKKRAKDGSLWPSAPAIV